jgi:hypothetical protein
LEAAVALSDSAASGDRLKALHDLRDLLARSIEACDSLRDMAALSGRFQAVLEDISKLEGPKEVGDGVDEIAQRRAARRAGSASR